MNDRIRAREIRVIDENGEQLGVLAPSEALAIARERELDLIEVAPTAQPPVCRIIDYGKWKYEQGKREKEQAKRQRQSELKGMTLTPRIEDHDLDMKTKNILRFLREGDKVKITVRFKWRELAHPEFALANLKKITDAMLLENIGQIERPAVLEGRQMIMVLSPVKDATKKVETVKKDKPRLPDANVKGDASIKGEKPMNMNAKTEAPKVTEEATTETTVEATENTESETKPAETVAIASEPITTEPARKE